MRLNYSRRVLTNLELIDTWSDNQRFVDGSLQLRYIDSADPWIDKGSAMDLIKSFSYDDTILSLNSISWTAWFMFGIKPVWTRTC